MTKGYYWRWKSDKHEKSFRSFVENLAKENDNYDKQHVKLTVAIPIRYQCPRPESCLGGTSSNCQIGYQGPLCAACDKGYYRMISSCVKCPTRTLLIVQVTLVALVVAFVVVLVIRAKRSSLNSGRSSIDIIFARAKIVVGFYQVMTGTLDGFGYTDLPPVLTRMVEFAKFVQLNILQIAPVHCFDNAYKINSYLHMTVTLSVAIAVVVFALGYYWVRKFWKHCKQKGEEDIDEDKELCIRNVFLILFIVYPDTSGKIFRTLPPVCHNLCADTSAVNCSSYLSTDYSLECYTD